MVQDMREIGFMAMLLERIAFSLTLMATFTKETGEMIKPTAKASINKNQVLHIKANGKMIYNMATAKKFGTMVESITVNSSSVKRKD